MPTIRSGMPGGLGKIKGIKKFRHKSFKVRSGKGPRGMRGMRSSKILRKGY